jgi:hypothetical protein
MADSVITFGQLTDHPNGGQCKIASTQADTSGVPYGPLIHAHQLFDGPDLSNRVRDPVSCNLRHHWKSFKINWAEELAMLSA